MSSRGLVENSGQNMGSRFRLEVLFYHPAPGLSVLNRQIISTFSWTFPWGRYPVMPVTRYFVNVHSSTSCPFKVSSASANVFATPPRSHPLAERFSAYRISGVRMTPGVLKGVVCQAEVTDIRNLRQSLF